MEILLLDFSSILSLTFFFRYSSYANGSETAFNLGATRMIEVTNNEERETQDPATLVDAGRISSGFSPRTAATEGWTDQTIDRLSCTERPKKTKKK